MGLRYSYKLLVDFWLDSTCCFTPELWSEKSPRAPETCNMARQDAEMPPSGYGQ